MFYQSTISKLGESYQDRQMEMADPGLSSYLGAVFDDAMARNPTSSLVRWAEIKRKESSGEQISQDILNEKYAIKGEKLFDAPTSDEAAKQIYEARSAELARQNVIGSGGQGFWRGAAGFVTGFATTFLDPGNIALAFIPGIGEAQIAKNFGIASKTAQRLIAGGATGLAQGLVAEIPIRLAADKERADYEMTDSLVNVLFSTAASGLIHAGTGKLADMLSKLDPQDRAAAIQGAVGRGLSGEPIDLGPVLDVHPKIVAEELRLGRTLDPDERMDLLSGKLDDPTLTSEADLFSASERERIIMQSPIVQEEIARRQAIYQNAQSAKQPTFDPEARISSGDDLADIKIKDDEIAALEAHVNEIKATDKLLHESDQGKKMLDDMAESQKIVRAEIKGLEVGINCFLRNM